jgi:hypothetical protein
VCNVTLDAKLLIGLFNILFQLFEILSFGSVDELSSLQPPAGVKWPCAAKWHEEWLLLYILVKFEFMDAVIDGAMCTNMLHAHTQCCVKTDLCP